MPRKIKKLIVKLRMLYADIRGHHGKRWNYEPGNWYMGRNKNKHNTYHIRDYYGSCVFALYLRILLE